MPQTRALTLITEDDFRIAATFYPAHQPNSPGLILVHGEGGTRSDWSPVANRAQDRGYNVMAIDLRGHGASARQIGKSINPESFTTDDWLACTQDIDAARKELIDRGAHPANIAAAGAGIGANLVLHHAVAHGDIQAIVLVSPGLTYEDVETEQAIQRYGKRPVMFIYAMGDTYSATSAQRLKQQATGYKELREYQGASHGTDVFQSSSHAVEQLLVWLEPIVGPGE